jgi:hypothetical protein
MTIKQYYASYKSLFGVMAGLVLASPILALIPINGSQYIFPPLGDVDIIARLISVAVTLVMTFIVYFYRPKAAVRAIAIAAVLFIFFAVMYAAAFSLFVRTIAVPSKDTSISLSVGFHRTEFAQTNFPGVSDEEMLRHRGLTEEEVRHCWTAASLLIARGILWLSCTLSLSFLVTTLGLGIIANNDESLGDADRESGLVPTSPPAVT